MAPPETNEAETPSPGLFAVYVRNGPGATVTITNAARLPGAATNHRTGAIWYGPDPGEALQLSQLALSSSPSIWYCSGAEPIFRVARNYQRRTGGPAPFNYAPPLYRSLTNLRARLSPPPSDAAIDTSGTTTPAERLATRRAQFVRDLGAALGARVNPYSRVLAPTLREMQTAPVVLPLFHLARATVAQWHQAQGTVYCGWYGAATRGRVPWRATPRTIVPVYILVRYFGDGSCRWYAVRRGTMTAATEIANLMRGARAPGLSPSGDPLTTARVHPDLLPARRTAASGTSRWRTVYDYHSNPRGTTRYLRSEHPSPDDCLLGFELELVNPGCDPISYSESDAATLAALTYATRDGSLSGGECVELVSCPLSQAAYRERIQGLSESLAALARNGWRGHDAPCSAGLHVHTSRAAWSAAGEWRAIQLLYRPSNRPVWEKVSRRRARDFQFTALGILDSRGLRIEPDAKLIRTLTSKRYFELRGSYTRPGHRIGGQNGRYVALNFTGATVELRLFRSTLVPASFHAAIETALALHGWAHDKAERARATSFGDFYRWAHDHRQTYPHLAPYLAARVGTNPELLSLTEREVA